MQSELNQGTAHITVSCLWLGIYMQVIWCYCSLCAWCVLLITHHHTMRSAPFEHMWGLCVCVCVTKVCFSFLPSIGPHWIFFFFFFCLTSDRQHPVSSLGLALSRSPNCTCLQEWLGAWEMNCAQILALVWYYLIYIVKFLMEFNNHTKGFVCANLVKITHIYTL